MGNAARAVSSSSPSAKSLARDASVVVRRIRPHVSLSAGVFVYVGYSGSEQWLRILLLRRSIADHRIVEGVALAWGAILDLEHADAGELAYATALQLLATREHSARELQAKLRRRRFSTEAADAAVQRCIHKGALDERRFVETVLRTAERKSHMSRARLCAKLRAAGVPENVMQQAIEDALVRDPTLFARALQRAFERVGGARASREVVTRRLLARGFEFKEITQLFA